MTSTSHALLFLFASLATVTGCRGSDALPMDAGAGDAAIPDAGLDPRIVRTGSGGVLLRGVVLAPDGPIDPGEVLIVGGLITCVAADCSTEPMAGAVTVIDTNGVVSPGLVDAHDHLAYDFLPEWTPDPPRLFRNRYEWAEDPSYEAFIAPYSAHRSAGTHFCPAAKWGELRAIAHATTTVQGESYEQGCVDRLARNADGAHGLGYDHMQTTIGSVRDITDADAQGYIDNFTAPDMPTTRLAVHMAEGIDGNGVELEFDSFAGRDTRTNRHMGVSMLADPGGAFRGTALLIHAIPITDAQIDEAAAAGASIVWSPSSNMTLYGVTAPIDRILASGITVALGPDWTPSGEDDMLGELRFALAYGEEHAVGALDAKRLWEMATAGGADAVGLGEHIGRLAPGMHADVAVFARGEPGSDPYAAVVEARAEDVVLVLIEGAGYYGDAALEAALAVNTECDALDACGASKFLCAKNTPGHESRAGESVGDIQQQLVDILEGTGYPADEQYGRGDELLPLVTCGR